MEATLDPISRPGKQQKQNQQKQKQKTWKAAKTKSSSTLNPVNLVGGSFFWTSIATRLFICVSISRSNPICTESARWSVGNTFRCGVPISTYWHRQEVPISIYWQCQGVPITKLPWFTYLLKLSIMFVTETIFSSSQLVGLRTFSSCLVLNICKALQNVWVPTN